MTRPSLLALPVLLALSVPACSEDPQPPPAEPAEKAPANDDAKADAPAADTGTAEADAAGPQDGNDTAAAMKKPDEDPLARKDPKGVESGPASEAIVATARKIQDDLGCLRGHRFKKDPDVRFQSIADFRAYVERQADKELDTPKGKQTMRMLKAIRLVDPDLDLRAITIQAAVEQAAAYYDPETNAFYVVQEMPEVLLNSVMAHELQHALQDQHTKLLDKYLEGGFGTHDRDLAARFIVEGEATLVGHAWLMYDMTRQMRGQAPICVLPPKGKDIPKGEANAFWPMIKPIVDEASRQTREQIVNPGALAKIATAAMSESMADSLDKLDDLPLYVFYSLLAPYNQGGMTVYEVFNANGYEWDTVQKLFENPPETTEQVLHPEKLVTHEGFEKIDHPAVPVPPAEADLWKPDPPDRVGELGIRILFIEHGVEETEAAKATDGWNGDSVKVYTREGLDAFDWVIVFDGPEDLAEFRAKLPTVMEHQRKGLKLDEAGKASITGAGDAKVNFTWTDPKGTARHGMVEFTGTRVRWTDGWTAAVSG